MLEIRPATIADAAAILKIYAPYVADTAVSFEEAVPTPAEFAARVQAICAEYPYLVCAENGALVGYAYAHRHRERAAYDWNAELSVYLAPAAQSRGIGSALYAALIEILALQNVRNVYGCVAIPNEKSEALHKKLGFADAGVWHKAGFKHGQWCDVAWFEKAIGEHAVPPKPFTPLGALDPAELEAVCARRTGQLNGRR